MKHRLILFLGALVVAAFLPAGFVLTSAEQNTNPQSQKEDAYRANNIGVAFLEQFKYREAAAEFRQALKVEPSLALARVNLGIALYNLPDLESAQRELKTAGEALPASPQVHYVLGLIAKAQNRTEIGRA